MAHFVILFVAATLVIFVTSSKHDLSSDNWSMRVKRTMFSCSQ